MEEVLTVFHPSHGFGVVRMIYTKTYGKWMPASVAENHLQVQRRVDRLMKAWENAEARISVQRCRLSQSMCFSGHCTWDLIPNAPKPPKSAFNCPTSEVCILHGSHVCIDAGQITATSAVNEAKNASHLVQCEVQKFDFEKRKDPGLRLGMFKALMEAVGQIPASDYILSNAGSGLGRTVYAARDAIPSECELHQAVLKVIKDWNRQMKQDPQMWRRLTHL